MIRVLQVVGSLNSGGSQSLLMNLYRNIDRDKVQFDFVIDRPNEIFYAKEIENLGGKIYICPQYKVYNHIKFIQFWNNFFKEHSEYKIIHGHVRSTASIYLKIAKKYGLYTIAHSHSTSSGKGISAIIKNFLQRNIRYVADFFMGCSQEANEWLFGKKIAHSNKCVIVNNAIDIKRYKPNYKIRQKIRDEFKIDDNTTLFGHVGRFIKAKNHVFLIDIFNYYYKQINKNSKLLLIGDGSLKKRIINKIKRYDLEEQIIIIDTVRNIEDYYNAMDIMIFPSIYEGFGMVLIEAQITNIKIIASDKVPKSTKISNMIKYLPLNIRLCDWANECDRMLHNEDKYKIDNNELIKYDINNQAKNIMFFYLSL